MGITIYVAGPVLRRESARIDILQFLYGQIEAEAKLAGVIVRLPYEDPELVNLEDQQFMEEIKRRIQAADAILVIVLPFITQDWWGNVTNYSVGSEAQIAAHAAKPVAILAQSADEVPRLLRALCGKRKPYTFATVNYAQLFQELSPPPTLQRGVRG